MKKILALIILASALFSCKKPQKPTQIWSNAKFLSAAKDSTKTTQSILDSIAPSVTEKAKTDSTTFYFGRKESEILEEEPFREITIVKLLNDSQIIATEIHFRDSIVNFYKLSKGKWAKIGSEKTDFDIFRIAFDDLDSDGKNEIITSTSPNMNGNRWFNVYRYSEKTKTVKYAGSFSTDYIVDKARKQIAETYEGSWYMDSQKTLYEWRGEMLVPIKRIVIAHELPVKNESGKLFFDYYENGSDKIDGLKRKSREVYVSDEKQNRFWDHFFD